MPIELGDGIISIRGDMKGFNKSLDLLRRQAGKSLLALGASVAAGLGLAVKTAADFEQAIVNAASVTGTVGADFDALKVHLEEVAQLLGRTTVFSAKEAANALLDLARKGFDVASISAEDMKGILDLAAATNSDLQSTTQLVTSTINRFGLTMGDTANIADIFTKAAGSSAITMEGLSVAMQNFGPTAAALGLSLEETTALIGKLSDAGLDFSTIGTGLRQIMIKMVNPTTKFNEVLEELGLTQADLGTEAGSLADSFGVLVEAGITAEQVLEAFGIRGGPVALSLFEVGTNAEAAGKEIDEFIGILEEVGDVAAETAAKQLDTLTGQVTLMESAFKGVLIPLGKALIPGLTKLAAKVAGVLQKVAEFAVENEKFFNMMVKIAGVVGVAAAALGGLLIVLPSLMAGFSALIAVGGAIAGALITPWGLVAAAVVAAVTLIIMNWGKILALFQAGGGLRPALDSVIATFNAFKSIAMAVWDGLRNFFIQNFEAISGIWENFKNTARGFGSILMSVFRLIVSTITSVLIGLAKGIATSLGKGSDDISSLGTNIVEGMKTMGDGIEEMVIFIAQQLEKFAGWWEKNSPVIIAFVSSVTTTMVNAFIWLADVLASRVSNILNIWRMLQSIGSSILGGLASFVEGIANRIARAIANIQNLISFFGGGSSARIPGFAAGTKATRSPFFMAGEGGKQELIAAPINSRVFNASETADILASAKGGGGEQIVNQFNGPLVSATITKEADVDRVIAALESKIMDSRLISGRGRRSNRRMQGVPIGGG